MSGAGDITPEAQEILDEMADPLASVVKQMNEIDARYQMVLEDLASNDQSAIEEAIVAARNGVLFSQPGLALLIPWEYWRKHVTQPIAGQLAALGASNRAWQGTPLEHYAYLKRPWEIITGKQVQDRQFDQAFAHAKASGLNTWMAYGEAFESWEKNGFIKFAIEVAADPFTYFGFGLTTPLKGLPVIGKVAAVEAAWVRAWDVPFKAAQHAVRQIPKTPFQAATSRSLAMMNQVRAYLEKPIRDTGIDIIGGTAFGRQSVTEVRLKLQLASDYFLSHPDAQNLIGDVGRWMTERPLLTREQVTAIARDLGGDVTEELAQPGWVGSIDNILRYTQGLGGNLNDLDDAVGLLLKAMNVDQSIKTIAKAKRLILGEADYIRTQVDAILRSKTSSEIMDNLFTRSKAIFEANQLNPVSQEASRGAMLMAGMIGPDWVRAGTSHAVWLWNTAAKWNMGFARFYLFFALYSPYNIGENAIKTMLMGLNPAWRGDIVAQLADNTVGIVNKPDIILRGAEYQINVGATIEAAAASTKHRLPGMSNNAFRRNMRKTQSLWKEILVVKPHDLMVAYGGRIGLKQVANVLNASFKRNSMEEFAEDFDILWNVTNKHKPLLAGHMEDDVADAYATELLRLEMTGNMPAVLLLSQNFTPVSIHMRDVQRMFSKYHTLGTEFGDWFQNRLQQHRFFDALEAGVLDTEVQEVLWQEIMNSPDIAAANMADIVQALADEPITTLAQYKMQIQALQDLQEVYSHVVMAQTKSMQARGRGMVDLAKKNTEFEEHWNNVLEPFMDSAERDATRLAESLRSRLGVVGEERATVIPETGRRLLSRDADVAVHGFQMSQLEHRAKNIQALGTEAEANVGFRLENGGDAFREIVGDGAEDYIQEKLARILGSLNDAEWRVALTPDGQQQLESMRIALSQAPPLKTERARLARELMQALVERDIHNIRRLAEAVRDATPGDAVTTGLGTIVFTPGDTTTISSRVTVRDVEQEIPRRMGFVVDIEGFDSIAFRVISPENDPTLGSVIITRLGEDVAALAKVPQAGLELSQTEWRNIFRGVLSRMPKITRLSGMRTTEGRAPHRFVQQLVDVSRLVRDEGPARLGETLTATQRSEFEQLLDAHLRQMAITRVARDNQHIMEQFMLHDPISGRDAIEASIRATEGRGNVRGLSSHPRIRQWWNDFHAARDKVWNDAEGDLANNLAELLELGTQIESAPLPPPKSVIGRPLTAADLAYLYRVSPAQLTNDIYLPELMALRGRAEFTARIRARAQRVGAQVGQSADELGYSVESVRAIYDVVLRRMRINPEAQNWYAPRFKQWESLRNELIAYSQRKNLVISPDSAVAVDRFAKAVYDELRSDERIGPRIFAPDNPPAPSIASRPDVDVSVDVVSVETLNMDDLSLTALRDDAPALGEGKVVDVSSGVTFRGFHGTQKAGLDDILNTTRERQSGGFHIGSSKAAAQRLEYKSTVPQIVSITTTGSEGTVVERLVTPHVMPIEVKLSRVLGSKANPLTEDDLFNLTNVPRFNKAVREAGFEGIIYRNLVEDPESLSLVVFDPTPSNVKAATIAPASGRQLSWNQRRQKAWDKTREEWEGNFPDYEHGQALTALMRGIYPFWTYEAHRWNYIPRMWAQKPGTYTAWANYMESTDDGYIPLGIAGVQVNPLRGTFMMGGLTRLVKRDYPEYYDRFPGAANAVDQLGRFGFYPGPLYTSFFASPVSNKAGEWQTGELMPPVTSPLGLVARMPMEVLQILAPQSTAAVALRELILPNRFRDYITANYVSEDGEFPGFQILDKLRLKQPLTPEEQAAWNRAQRKTSIFALSSEQTGMIRLRPEERITAQDLARQIIADYTGITVAQQRDMQRKGLRIEEHLSFHPDLNDALQGVAEIAQWRGLSTHLTESAVGKQVAVQRQFWAAVQVERDRITVEQNRLDGEWRSGLINHNDWDRERKELNGRITTFIETLRTTPAYKDVPVSLQERLDWAAGNSTQPPIQHPLEELLSFYYEKRPDDFRVFDPEVNAQVTDWNAYFRWRTTIEQSLNPSQMAAFSRQVEKNDTVLELTHRRDYEQYINPYDNAFDVILERHDDASQAVIKRFYFVAGENPEEADALREQLGTDGEKIVAGFQSLLSDFRRAMRQIDPELDGRLLFWGKATSPTTPAGLQKWRELRVERGFAS